MQAYFERCLVSRIVESRDKSRWYVTFHTPDGSWDITLPLAENEQQHLQFIHDAFQGMVPLTIQFILRPLVYERNLRLVGRIVNIGQFQSRRADSAAKS